MLDFLSHPRTMGTIDSTTREKEMMKRLDNAMRTDLIELARQSDDEEMLAFADELEASGKYTEATQDEIERFMELV